MEVNAWTCAPATASDLESAWRSISNQDPKDVELCLRRVTCKSFFTFGYGSERQTEPSHSWFPLLFSLRITETEQLYQAKRMIGLKMGEIQRVTFGELLKHVITLCGQILVSRKLACVFCVVCCAHVETHRVVPAFTGDVLNVHTRTC